MMLPLLTLLAVAGTALAGEINHVDYPSQQTFNCGSSHTFKWAYDTDYFSKNPTDQLEIVLVQETIGDNEVIQVLATVSPTETSYQFSIPRPFPEAWTAESNEHRIADPTKPTDVHLELRAKGDHDINDDCGFCNDPYFKIECVDCNEGDLGCPCINAGTENKCNTFGEDNTQLLCTNDGVCQEPQTTIGKGIYLIEFLEEDKACGFSYKLQWTYDEEASKFFTAQTDAEKKKLAIYLVRDDLFNDHRVAKLAEVSADVLSHTVEIPSSLPAEWIAESNEGKLNNNGVSNDVYFLIESVANPLTYSSVGGNFFRDTDPHFSLTCCPDGDKDCQCLAGDICNDGFKCTGTTEKKCVLDDACAEGEDKCSCIGGVGGECVEGVVCQVTGICRVGMLEGAGCAPSSQTQLGLCSKSPEGMGPFACVDGKCASCAAGVADCICKSGTCNDSDHVCYMNHCVPKERTGCLDCPCGENDVCEANQGLACKTVASGDKICQLDSNAMPTMCGTQVCSAGFTCQNEMCVPVGPECSSSNFSGTCPTGQTCSSGVCQQSASTDCNPACAAGTVCQGGTCVNTQATPTPGTDDCSSPCPVLPTCPTGQSREQQKNKCNCDIDTPCEASNASIVVVSLLVAVVAVAFHI